MTSLNKPFGLYESVYGFESLLIFNYCLVCKIFVPQSNVCLSVCRMFVRLFVACSSICSLITHLSVPIIVRHEPQTHLFNK